MGHALVKVISGELYPYLKDITLYGRIEDGQGGETIGKFYIHGCKDEEQKQFYKGILQWLNESINKFGFETVDEVEQFWIDSCDGMFLTIEEGDYEAIVDIKETEKNKIEKIIEDAPDKCPITGLKKCKSYIFDDSAVYLSDPAYYAFTLPIYDAETGEFLRTRYDLDDDFRQEDEYLCHIDDLRGREDFEEIRRFYNIKK